MQDEHIYTFKKKSTTCRRADIMGGFNEAEWSKNYSSDLPLKFRYIYIYLH